ncbi:uncharacterized protein LOC113228337 isoform X2 [Hyposmocoma kahamanoa]|uniref:uncharacterized protein LOC113228337 isoform X2 n=1 Tax=Hyposmocoma kahamanoa TaxID=1477025 RepID=UPI000E6D6150|nr:uncharacterized protein LOC113228337 isoform X2 [Hyposmocoma kahamanoa]
MWGESSKNCEINCQCSELIPVSFKIDSGNNATKRKKEEAVTANYKLKMLPQSLALNSPTHTPSKRRILGEIQNSSLFRPSNTENIKSPLFLQKKSDIPFLPKNSPVIDRILTPLKKSPLIDNNSSPVTTRSSFTLKRTKTSTNKITRIFEDRSNFKMSNKENVLSKSFMKIEVEEETRDCTFSDTFRRATSTNWSMTKLDFTDALQSTSFEMSTKSEADTFVPEKELIQDLDPEFETLHDLEEEFENDHFDQCTKYEIISTDSPNIISRGRSTARKVDSRNFVFGAPLADDEQSTSFNKPNITATRSLNFEECFEFTSPAARKTSFSVKKSLKFNETPTKKGDKFETPTKHHPLRHEQSDSSIGSMASFASSPSCSQLRLFTSESTTSMESGFISELEEPFLDLEETSNSPKVPNFNDLLSGQIKENFLTEKNFLKRPTLHRSFSLNQEPKAKVSLFSIKEIADVKKSQKRQETETDVDNMDNKRRKSNSGSPESLVMMEKPQRPILQRAFSENHASIMSAVARSTEESDLIGDFSLPCALPLVSGDHQDLKCISADTLAGLLKGDFHDCIGDFQVSSRFLPNA